MPIARQKYIHIPLCFVVLVLSCLQWITKSRTKKRSELSNRFHLCIYCFESNMLTILHSFTHLPVFDTFCIPMIKYEIMRNKANTTTPYFVTFITNHNTPSSSSGRVWKHFHASESECKRSSVFLHTYIAIFSTWKGIYEHTPFWRGIECIASIIHLIWDLYCFGSIIEPRGETL